jgi:hypothetical protein
VALPGPPVLIFRRIHQGQHSHQTWVFYLAKLSSYTNIHHSSSPSPPIPLKLKRHLSVTPIHLRANFQADPRSCSDAVQPLFPTPLDLHSCQDTLVSPRSLAGSLPRFAHTYVHIPSTRSSICGALAVVLPTQFLSCTLH